MKEVLLQESMNVVVVTEVNVASLKMVNPVAARVLKLHRQISPYPVAHNLADTGTRLVQATHISFEIFGHKPQAAIC